MSMPQRGTPGGLAQIIQTFVVAIKLMFSARVPGWAKLVPLAALAYLLFPLDFLPDLIPGIGQVDDLTVILIGMWTFMQLCPQDVVREYMGKNGDVVDGSYRVVKDDDKPAAPPSEQIPPPRR